MNPQSPKRKAKTTFPGPQDDWMKDISPPPQLKTRLLFPEGHPIPVDLSPSLLHVGENVKSPQGTQQLRRYLGGMSRRNLYDFCGHHILARTLNRYRAVREMEDAYNWALQSRDKQKLPQGNWRTWLIMAGRGFGKTRTGAESIRQWVDSGKCRTIALVGKNLREARSVMVEGISGILNVYPPKNRPTFYPSKRLILWPNGARAVLFSGDMPDSLRGPEFDGAWIDELAKYRNPEEMMNQLRLALRQGNNPQMIITTTPRPLKMLQDMVDHSTACDEIFCTQGTTFENQENLAESFTEALQKTYGGTLLGSQEVYGELLDIRDQALWSQVRLDRYRFDEEPVFARVVVGVDPAATHGESSDETGIVVVGLDYKGMAYVLDDFSGRYPPSRWAQIAVDAYHKYKAHRLVAETNKGGDMIEDLLRAIDRNVSFKGVRATHGKGARAEPIAALYEKGRVFHRRQGLEKLEKQMLSYVPGRTSKSPDRIDALVWALTELVLREQANMTPSIWSLT